MTGFPRRHFLAAAAAASWVDPALALPVPKAKRLGFEVVRNGSVIGHHTLSFAADGDLLTVSVDVEIAVKILGIRVFHYRHTNAEHWQGDQFVGFEAETDDDGKHYKASAVKGTDGFSVTSTAVASYTAPAAALCATHWNRRQLDGPMINPQDGKTLQPAIERAGPSSVALADKRQVTADKYVLTGDMRLTLWYADDQAWTALSFVAGDGSTVDYRLS